MSNRHDHVANYRNGIQSQILLLFSSTEQQPRSRQANVGDRFSENMSVLMKSPQRV